VVALHEGELIVRRIKGRPPKVALVATDGITPPIWFGQGADPEILGVFSVGVHRLVDEAPLPQTRSTGLPLAPAGLRIWQPMGAGHWRRFDQPKRGRVLMPRGSNPEPIKLQPTKKPRQRQG